MKGALLFQSRLLGQCPVSPKASSCAAGRSKQVELGKQERAVAAAASMHVGQHTAMHYDTTCNTSLASSETLTSPTIVTTSSCKKAHEDSERPLEGELSRHVLH